MTSRPEQVSAYRFIAKIKNNRLWMAIKDKFPEVKNQADAARLLCIAPTTMGDLLNMKLWPYSKRKRDYAPLAYRISIALGKTPDFLFDPLLYGEPPINSSIEIEFHPPSLIAASKQLMVDAPQEAELIQKELSKELVSLVDTLPYQERYVIKKVFGIGGQEFSAVELAEMIGVTPQQIFQYKQQALAKLRHPSRRRFLDKVKP